MEDKLKSCFVSSVHFFFLFKNHWYVEVLNFEMSGFLKTVSLGSKYT